MTSPLLLLLAPPMPFAVLLQPSVIGIATAAAIDAARRARLRSDGATSLGVSAKKMLPCSSNM